MAAPPATREIEPYYSDAEVAALLDPSGKRIKPRSIRSEQERGRLIGTKVAGKWMYRQSDVQNFLEAARKCPEPTPARAWSSDGALVPNRSSASNGPSGAAASDMEPAYLPPILTRRRPTSEPGSEAAPRPRGPAQVVPIKSE